ncbi:efflux RND transporter periplasmic adaptor subunit [Thalassotalea sp. HSM 43]|uniref:efflux RND transporter periplasmic adaptor subunit n=1 Tax=Thalassotalea sp. HSM 43 TaxID=2552945 RepID=UPI00108145A3|nr:efflux RND transporter periplasmic adaptor subunit [Thalassotalea sp. HSM 43]QBY05415.1 efflux RND transporter periplasmic adaptor subunit [Thalassotalea sp. HSM 43]
MKKAISVLCISASLVLSLSACDQKQRAQQQIEVVVQDVKTYPYQGGEEFVGRLEAVSDVEIIARVKAPIEKVHFKQGAMVTEGEVLYTLNQDELKAQYDQAQAEVGKSSSALDIARKNYNRGLELAPDGYISGSELDQLESKVSETNAQLEATKANLRNAQVNLDYTEIHAPIGGKIDRSKFTSGDLVGPDVGSLTSIVAEDTMEIPFQVSEKVYWRMVRKMQRGEVSKSSRKAIVEIAFSANDIYEHQGSINFVSNRVNPETGSMEVRASVPNPDGILKPGQYVTVNIKVPVAVDTPMISQMAVQSDQQGDYVLVVDKKGVVNRVNVQLGRRVDTLVIVETGLEIGAQVIIRGVQRVRDGLQVKAIHMDDIEQAASSVSVIES